MINKLLYVIFIVGIIVLSFFSYTFGESNGSIYGGNDGRTYGYNSGYANGNNVGYKDGNDSGEMNGGIHGYKRGWDDAEIRAVNDLLQKRMPPITPPTSLYIEDSYLINPKILHNPSYSELVEFLLIDGTNNLKYADNFNCWGFAITMKKHAEQYGLRCAIVSMTYEDKLTGEATIGHVINMFDTTNYVGENSNIYVDAQTDTIMGDIVIGGSYDWYNKYANYIYRGVRLGVDYPAGYIYDAYAYMNGPYVPSNDNIAKMNIIW
jgi:hypothetical protein